MHPCDNDHLPAWLRHAMNSAHPVRVDFTGARYVSVCPQQRRYHSNIVDWSDATEDHAPAGFVHLQEHFPAEHAQPIKHLHWTLLLQRIQMQQLRQGIDFEFHVMRLLSWPPLTDLPDDLVPIVSRLCALLARKPTATSLIPLTLGLPTQQVFPIIEALRLKGHLVAMNAALSAETAAHAESDRTVSAPAATDLRPPPANALITKIWQRLLPRS